MSGAPPFTLHGAPDSTPQSLGVYVNQASVTNMDVTERALQAALGRTSRSMSQTAYLACLQNVRQEMHMPMSLEEFLEVGGVDEPGLTLLYMWIENRALNVALYKVIEAFAYRGSLSGILEEWEIEVVDEMFDHCIQIVDAWDEQLQTQIARERQTPHRINGRRN